MKRDELRQTVLSLCAGETDAIALMATLAAEVHRADDRCSWTGFTVLWTPIC